MNPTDTLMMTQAIPMQYIGHPPCPNFFDYITSLNAPEETRDFYYEAGILYAELAQHLRNFDPLTLKNFERTLEAMQAYATYTQIHSLNKRIAIQAGISQIRLSYDISRKVESPIYPAHLWRDYANCIPLSHRISRLFYEKGLCPCGQKHQHPEPSSENTINDSNRFEPGLTYPNRKEVNPLIQIMQGPIEDEFFFKEGPYETSFPISLDLSRPDAGTKIHKHSVFPASSPPRSPKKGQKFEKVLGVEKKFTFGVKLASPKDLKQYPGNRLGSGRLSPLNAVTIAGVIALAVL
ncbi:hypothetical protein TWF225_010677 [Orbilia oligospora]|uniref:Uncharacterized protein n=1 Tax=Orbilia oligospora TaxID=2813651 RepID=A0A7C8VL33_ORBOL|nr:hypothetical protein TWF225_010677 [Orbilia oligospora]KAF3240646.1 hypothetical protein TWF128_011261 [Orbilia oligospora]KAF3243653.1 hypothetical protein TWF217_011162 [Orbilia oligospora]KAF3281833.1 hypothetical protein TWF132_011055 [Orbilia oligospora]KAF3286582.1 hypothetical protein TWF970_008434 [Orbilia oligospora]